MRFGLPPKWSQGTYRTNCARCTHSSDWHRIDDSKNLGPCDSGVQFRCLGYDPTEARPPVRRCDCPDMVHERKEE